MSAEPTHPPFEIAVSLNPHVEPIAVATATSYEAANAAVRTIAARYGKRYGAHVVHEKITKRGYLELRLVFDQPAAGAGSIRVVARAATSRFGR
jgi:hypothetical protein